VPGTLNAHTLPDDDNVNPYVFCIALNGDWFMSKGAMLAYYGTVRFEAVTEYSSVQGWVAARFSSPVYVQDWVVASGHGKVLIGDRGFDLNSYDLDDGNLTIKASNLCAFSPQLELKQSIVPGFVTLIGTGKFIASSNGPVIFVEPPFRADPEALLGWADCPSPSVHHDAQWMTQSIRGMLSGALGRASGRSGSTTSPGRARSCCSPPRSPARTRRCSGWWSRRPSCSPTPRPAPSAGG
jgi:hypothetical protein